ncbi:hypothetical protein GCM10009528_32410 [Kineococcus aurantiacus]
MLVCCTGPLLSEGAKVCVSGRARLSLESDTSEVRVEAELTRRLRRGGGQTTAAEAAVVVVRDHRGGVGVTWSRGGGPARACGR